MKHLKRFLKEFNHDGPVDFGGIPEKPKGTAEHFTNIMGDYLDHMEKDMGGELNDHQYTQGLGGISDRIKEHFPHHKGVEEAWNDIEQTMDEKGKTKAWQRIRHHKNRLFGADGSLKESVEINEMYGIEEQGRLAAAHIKKIDPSHSNVRGMADSMRNTDFDSAAEHYRQMPAEHQAKAAAVLKTFSQSAGHRNMASDLHGAVMSKIKQPGDSPLKDMNTAGNKDISLGNHDAFDANYSSKQHFIHHALKAAYHLDSWHRSNSPGSASAMAHNDGFSKHYDELAKEHGKDTARLTLVDGDPRADEVVRRIRQHAAYMTESTELTEKKHVGARTTHISIRSSKTGAGGVLSGPDLGYARVAGTGGGGGYRTTVPAGGGNRQHRYGARPKAGKRSIAAPAVHPGTKTKHEGQEMAQNENTLAESIHELVTAAKSDNPARVSEIFDSLVKDRLSGMIEDRKTWIAHNKFREDVDPNPEDEEEIEEVEADEEEAAE